MVYLLGTIESSISMNFPAAVGAADPASENAASCCCSVDKRFILQPGTPTVPLMLLYYKNNPQTDTIFPANQSQKKRHSDALETQPVQPQPSSFKRFKGVDGSRLTKQEKGKGPENTTFSRPLSPAHINSTMPTFLDVKVGTGVEVESDSHVEVKWTGQIEGGKHAIKAYHILYCKQLDNRNLIADRMPLRMQQVPQQLENSNSYQPLPLPYHIIPYRLCSCQQDG